MTAPPREDHRRRVGRARRARTRDRLIEAATLVFAELGPDVTQIDDVIRRAGVSRGTFYNYFRSTEEVLHAVIEALSSEMVGLVGTAADPHAPPGARFADGIKAFVDLADRHPLLLDFVSRLGLGTLGATALIPALAPDRIAEVIAPEATEALAPGLARDIVKAATLALLLRLRAGSAVDVAGFAAAMLRTLGHAPAEAARLAARPFVPLDIPEGSLILRGEKARRPRGILPA